MVVQVQLLGRVRPPPGALAPEPDRRGAEVEEMEAMNPRQRRLSSPTVSSLSILSPYNTVLGAAMEKTTLSKPQDLI